MYYEFLRKVPLFADLPDADLERLCEMVEEVRLAPGQVLFHEGATGDHAYVLKDGEIEIVKTASGREVLLAVRGESGDVFGEMSLLEDVPRNATIRARRDSLLIAIHREQFEHLLDTSAAAARAMLDIILGRWRSTQTMLRQGEKMAQLGTLTAGVAHELNNPAAAVQRAVGQLGDAFANLGQTQTRLSQAIISSEQQAVLQELSETARQRAQQPLILNALARSDQEQEAEEWLEDHTIPRAWELASTLVNLGYDVAGLEAMAQRFDADALPGIIDWLGATYTVHNLLAEVNQAARRISDIVKALKSYSYLDQAPVQDVNVHEGLDNTLLILRYKLQPGITIRREYDPDLPLIQAYGSELNQVWTNIIDNAADALNGQGEVTIRTKHENGWVVVDIEDNGPGIPPEVQNRVFDAFFTTKPPGKGTGLGLDISYRIVTERHRGDIKVYSRPGKTSFQVWLPVQSDAPDRSVSPMDSVLRPSDEALRHIYETTHTIAVVGASRRKDRPAYSVPAYLQTHGYRIIPVNPSLDELFGEKAYPDLSSIPDPVDVALIFRRSEEVPAIVEQAIGIGAKVVWMQEGIVHEAAAATALTAGLQVVMHLCMRNTHKRLYGVS